MDININSRNISLPLFTMVLVSALIFSCWLLDVSTAWAKDILVVQNVRVKPYDEALRGFKSALAGKIANTDYRAVESTADIGMAVRKNRPDVILAVGMDSLAQVKDIKNIPIVYVMVLNPRSVAPGGKNITGVSMAIPPEKHFAVLNKTLPSVKRIGLLYDPKRNGHYVKQAQTSARSYGFELVAKEIHSPRDVPAALVNLKDKIDLIWIVPDISVVTPETTDHLMLYSLENRIPVHIFSGKYLEMGAFSSLDTNPYDMGRQAGEIASRILNGTAVTEISGSDATNPVLSINLKTARKLGISIPPDALERSRVIR